MSDLDDLIARMNRLEAKRKAAMQDPSKLEPELRAEPFVPSPMPEPPVNNTTEVLAIFRPHLLYTDVLPTPERKAWFMSKMRVDADDHWLAINGQGGAVFQDHGPKVSYTIIGWVLFKGYLEPGDTVKRVCSMTGCYNPMHMEKRGVRWRTENRGGVETQDEMRRTKPSGQSVGSVSQSTMHGSHVQQPEQGNSSTFYTEKHLTPKRPRRPRTP